MKIMWHGLYVLSQRAVLQALQTVTLPQIKKFGKGDWEVISDNISNNIKREVKSSPVRTSGLWGEKEKQQTKPQISEQTLLFPKIPR